RGERDRQDDRDEEQQERGPQEHDRPEAQPGSDQLENRSDRHVNIPTAHWNLGAAARGKTTSVTCWAAAHSAAKPSRLFTRRPRAGSRVRTRWFERSIPTTTS